MTIVLLLIANFLKSKLWISVVVHKTCIVMTVILAFSVYFADTLLMQVWSGVVWFLLGGLQMQNLDNKGT